MKIEMEAILPPSPLALHSPIQALDWRKELIKRFKMDVHVVLIIFFEPELNCG